MNTDIKIVVIDDDPRVQEDAVWERIEHNVSEIKFFQNANEGLNFIKQNLSVRIIVFLDWKFGSGLRQGNDVLNEIHILSPYIPVIVFTGQNINIEETERMFNGCAFRCVSKSADTQVLLETINQAIRKIQTDITYVIERWIDEHGQDALQEPYISSAGKTYSLKEIMDNIREQSPFGQELTQGIFSLATELFLKKGCKNESKNTYMCR